MKCFFKWKGGNTDLSYTELYEELIYFYSLHNETETLGLAFL